MSSKCILMNLLKGIIKHRNKKEGSDEKDKYNKKVAQKYCVFDENGEINEDIVLMI